MLLFFLTALNVLLGGLLAGVEVAVRYGVRAALEAQPVPTHLRLRQALIRTLRYLVPAIYFPTLASGVAVALLAGLDQRWVARAVGLLALAVWLAVTLGGTVPINSAALEWSPEDPPAEWRLLVDRWDLLAAVRVGGAVVAFAAFIVAGIALPAA
jgi:anthrone oxygenase-like protein